MQIINLTLQERYNIIKYAQILPSTLGTYFNFPVFEEIFAFTPEEEAKYDIKVEDGVLKCNCPDRTFDVDVSNVPEAIHSAIKLRITEYKAEMGKLRESNRGNPGYADSPLFRAFIDSLSKLLDPDELKETEYAGPDAGTAVRPKFTLIDMLRSKKGK